MQTLPGLRAYVHDRVNAFKTIEKTIERPHFSRIWIDSTEEQQKQIIDIIERGDRPALSKLIRTHPSLDLAERPVAELRKIARNLHVKYYCSLSFEELIVEIMKKEKANAQS